MNTFFICEVNRISSGLQFTCSPIIRDQRIEVKCGKRGVVIIDIRTGKHYLSQQERKKGRYRLHRPKSGVCARFR